MYQVKQSEYVLSAAWKSQWPDESLPEICLAGRSNVGKSSLINTLTNRRKLAHVSATPGKTRTLNFYEINHELRFVDVPGYGYAKVSMKIKESFGKMMEEYISSRPNLKGMVLIVDYRHPPTKDDKLKRSELQKNKKIIKEKLGLQDEDRFIAFSSVKKLNVDAVWDAIWELLKENA